MENLPAKQQTQSIVLTQFLPKGELIQTTTYNNLSPIEKEMALALLEPKIKDFTPEQMTVSMIGLIGKTHLSCGFPLDKERLNFTIDELCNDLKKYNGNLTFKEIELAFKNGYKKQYGDFFGLSNATYFGWVNAYTWAENRLRVKKAILDSKENAKKEPEKKSDEEIEYILKAGVLKSFDDFRDGVIILDAGNVKYNYLVKKGLINLTKERKAELMISSELRLKENAIKTKQLNETISKVFAKILESSITSEAKKEALLQYFKELVSMEIELSDELK